MNASTIVNMRQFQPSIQKWGKSSQSRVRIHRKSTKIMTGAAVTATLCCLAAGCVLQIFMLHTRRKKFDFYTAMVIDIVSVGSVLRPAYQEAQRRTFAQHPSVRMFYPVDEWNDTDATCSEWLNATQLRNIVEYCNNGTTPLIEDDLSQLLHGKFRPKRDSGWLCAQKRPLEALYTVLDQYRRNGMASLPDYIFILDDDTFLPNMDGLGLVLRSEYPPELPFAVGSCFVGGTSGFMIPFGGFGSILTRAAIQNLLHPLHCSYLDAAPDPAGSSTNTVRRQQQQQTSDDDDRRSLLCCDHLLKQNTMGEKFFFRQGMSVIDIMYQYSSQQPFTSIHGEASVDVISSTDIGGVFKPWSNGSSGFCMHSDHALAYFINMYYIGFSFTILKSHSPADILKQQQWHRYWNSRKKALSTLYGYTSMKPSQCDNRESKCSLHHLVCHYITPDKMNALFSDSLTR